jgi:hypothetical protein
MGIEASPQVRPDEPRPSAGRRAAAAAGLLAAAGALALVVAGLVNSPLRLGLALIALCVALMAAWTALVNHGARRVLAGVVAVVALVGLVALFDLRSIVRISLVVGLVLVSAAAARVALAHDLAPAASDSRKVGPAQSGVLLMNPWSGGGKVERFDLEAQARRRGVTPVVLRRGDDLRALAEQAVDAGADVIGLTMRPPACRAAACTEAEPPAYGGPASQRDLPQRDHLQAQCTAPGQQLVHLRRVGQHPPDRRLGAGPDDPPVAERATGSLRQVPGHPQFDTSSGGRACTCRRNRIRGCEAHDRHRHGLGHGPQSRRWRSGRLARAARPVGFSRRTRAGGLAAGFVTSRP